MVFAVIFMPPSSWVGSRQEFRIRNCFILAPPSHVLPNSCALKRWWVLEVKVWKWC
jgi:hypothetical protein